jgi:hypothetical protein
MVNIQNVPGSIPPNSADFERGNNYSVASLMTTCHQLKQQKLANVAENLIHLI